jgi:hypothetical protein
MTIMRLKADEGDMPGRERASFLASFVLACFVPALAPQAFLMKPGLGEKIMPSSSQYSRAALT